MLYTIKRIPLWPLAKVVFLLSFALMVVGLLFYSLTLTTVMSTMGELFGEELSGLGTLGGAAMFGVSLFGALFGAFFQTLMAVLGALLYNGLAGALGGIELEMESTALEPSLPGASTIQASPPHAEPARPAGPVEGGGEQQDQTGRQG